MWAGLGFYTGHTINDFGDKMAGTLGLFDAISFHDLAILVDADVPGPARLGLTVQH